MSYEYAMSRVRDALEKSDGNHLKAQRLILGWIENDHTLLFGLVTPHLQGIISHAINHVLAPPKKKVAGTSRRLDVVSEPNEFGAALLHGAQAGEGGAFGEPTPRGVSRPGKASQKHVDAINKLAGASKAKGKGDKKK